jgi:hypothetical protein
MYIPKQELLEMRLISKYFQKVIFDFVVISIPFEDNKNLKIFQLKHFKKIGEIDVDTTFINGLKVEDMIPCANLDVLEKEDSESLQDILSHLIKNLEINTMLKSIYLGNCAFSCKQMVKILEILGNNLTTFKLSFSRPYEMDKIVLNTLCSFLQKSKNLEEISLCSLNPNKDTSLLKVLDLIKDFNIKALLLGLDPFTEKVGGKIANLIRKNKELDMLSLNVLPKQEYIGFREIVETLNNSKVNLTRLVIGGFIRRIDINCMTLLCNYIRSSNSLKSIDIIEFEEPDNLSKMNKFCEAISKNSSLESVRIRFGTRDRVPALPILKKLQKALQTHKSLKHFSMFGVLMTSECYNIVNTIIDTNHNLDAIHFEFVYHDQSVIDNIKCLIDIRTSMITNYTLKSFKIEDERGGIGYPKMNIIYHQISSFCQQNQIVYTDAPEIFEELKELSKQ